MKFAFFNGDEGYFGAGELIFADDRRIIDAGRVVCFNSEFVAAYIKIGVGNVGDCYIVGQSLTE